MTRTARIELRAEPEREQRIRLAAELANQSMTAFVLDAATERADEVIAAAATTTVAADFFDALLAALDQPAEPNKALARAARRPRRVHQA
jgi:uncharacterized protein (DUF1778 family)